MGVNCMVCALKEILQSLDQLPNYNSQNCNFVSGFHFLLITTVLAEILVKMLEGT